MLAKGHRLTTRCGGRYQEGNVNPMLAQRAQSRRGDDIDAAPGHPGIRIVVADRKEHRVDDQASRQECEAQTLRQGYHAELLPDAARYRRKYPPIESSEWTTDCQQPQAGGKRRSSAMAASTWCTRETDSATRHERETHTQRERPSRHPALTPRASTAAGWNWPRIATVTAGRKSERLT